MITDGSITLPSGQTVSAGQGGSYCIGSDSYPVTIVGWTGSGKTIYYQSAIARHTKNSNYYGTQRYLFAANPSAPVNAATWRRADSSFKPKGRACGYISTNGYHKRSDPSY